MALGPKEQAAILWDHLATFTALITIKSPATTDYDYLMDLVIDAYESCDDPAEAALWDAAREYIHVRRQRSDRPLP